MADDNQISGFEWIVQTLVVAKYPKGLYNIRFILFTLFTYGY